MSADLERIYEKLYAWCSARGFEGFDPFDGLNSRVFQATPLRNYRYPRLLITQLVKRSPVDLRPMLGVRLGVNPKGIALFALAELSRQRATDGREHAGNARALLERLLSMGVHDGSTLAWGYNFDWQSRVFYAPKGTPTIVPTAFASQAFAEALALFGEDRYRRAVDEIAEFAATKLHRSIDKDDEVCFSYTPIDESVIFNASLLAAECLMRSADPAHHALALKAVNYVVRQQRQDGAWTYGAGDPQGWVDNFHTAYVLQSIRRLADTLGTDEEIETAFEKGKEYWLTNFFLEDGTPKYYNEAPYPIDIHSAAVAIATLAEFGEIRLSRKVAEWTVRHMLDVDGFFYYQLGRFVVNQTAFMRWGQAWMAYALARLMEAEAN